MDYHDFDTSKPFYMTGGDYSFRLPYPAEISLTAATGTVRIKEERMPQSKRPPSPLVGSILDVLDLMKEASTLLRQAALQLDNSATVTYGMQNKIKAKSEEIAALMNEVQTTFAGQFVQYVREQLEKEHGHSNHSTN